MATTVGMTGAWKCRAGYQEIRNLTQEFAYGNLAELEELLNSLEMVTAMKCIDILQRDNVLKSIWQGGEDFLARLTKIVKDSGVPATVSGISPMPFLTFDKVDDNYKGRRDRFYTETIRRHLFIQPYHHWYIAHRHTAEDLDTALTAIAESLHVVSKEY